MGTHRKDHEDGETVRERRLVFVPVGSDWLINWLLKGESQIGYRVEGLPGDAVYIGCHDDPLTMNVYFVFSHESFAPVPPECQPPILMTTLFRMEQTRTATA